MSEWWNSSLQCHHVRIWGCTRAGCLRPKLPKSAHPTWPSFLPCLEAPPVLPAGPSWRFGLVCSQQPQLAGERLKTSPATTTQWRWEEERNLRPFQDVITYHQPAILLHVRQLPVLPTYIGSKVHWRGIVALSCLLLFSTHNSPLCARYVDSLSAPMRPPHIMLNRE